MSEKIYPSRIDWWLAAVLALPPAASVMVITQGEVGPGIVALAGYALLIGGLVLPMNYAVNDAGIRIQFGLVKLRISWDRVVGMRPSSNPLSSPALSLKRLDVTYRKANGSQTSVLISPADRAVFVAACAAASGKHRADGELLVAI